MELKQIAEQTGYYELIEEADRNNVNPRKSIWYTLDGYREEPAIKSY